MEVASIVRGRVVVVEVVVVPEVGPVVCEVVVVAEFAVGFGLRRVLLVAVSARDMVCTELHL